MHDADIQLLCIGANYAAPGPFLEKLRLAPEEMAELLAGLKREGLVEEAFGVVTRSRVELYLATADATAARESLVGRLRGAGRLGDKNDLQHLTTHRGESVARHLFRLAAGLDSPLAGESEILGQLRSAHEAGLNSGVCGETLSALAGRAIALGERLRDDPEFSGLYLSVVTVALRLAAKVFGSLDERMAVQIGEGETARLLGRQLHRRGVVLGEAPGEAEIVVLATNAPGKVPIPAPASRSKSYRVVFDLRSRRDDGASDAEGIFRFRLDQLEAAARKNRHEGTGEIARIEQVIEDEVGRYSLWLRNIEVRRLVQALRENIEAIRQAHIEKHARNLTPDESAQLEAFTRELLKNVVDDVTGNFKNIDLETELGVQEYNLIRSLFNIRREQPPQS